MEFKYSFPKHKATYIIEQLYWILLIQSTVLNIVLVSIIDVSDFFHQQNLCMTINCITLSNT